MSVSDLEIAKKELAEREGIKDKHIDSLIGYWHRQSEPLDPISQTITTWAESKDLGAVIWTALTPKFQGKERVPSPEEVIQFLSNLSYKRMKYAEEYIRKAPRQIDTEYRRVIERQFGWTPIPLGN